jgi:DNA primase
LHEQLKESLRTLVSSEDWRQALEVAARFHNYSFANTRLIWAQAAARGFTPTRVAGYRAWQKLGRQVNRGEKGLQILAPITRTVETDDGEEERRVVGFRVVHMFDQSQTDGNPLPEVRPAALDGELPVQWEKVAELIRSADFGLDIAEVDRLGEANGITDWGDRTVVVRASLPGAQRFKTAVHELAHIRLHEPTSGDRPDCRGVIEVEAESVAYMVCAALGVDSAGYSLPYVATWSGGDLEKVAETADRVIRCARRIITDIGVDQHLERDRSVTVVTGSGRPTGKPSLDESLIDGVAVAELEEALEVAVSYYQDQLDRSGEARAFLSERGITAQSAERWQLGFAPPRWDGLVNSLRGQGVADELLVEAGLAGRARTGRVYDRMRGRIIFPIHDAQGSPRGLAGRLITGAGPKYLNSPQTQLYRKSELLYGLHLAAEAIAGQGRAVVVEGYTDAIAAYQAGFSNTVATGGTALTEHHLEALKSTAPAVTLAFDGDQAGLQAAERVADLPAQLLQDVNISLVSLPSGTDPAGLIANGMTDVLRAGVTNPTPLLHHLIDHTLCRYDFAGVEARVRALHRVAPLVDRFCGSGDRRDVVNYLAHRFDRDEDYIRQALAEAPLTSYRRSKRNVTRSPIQVSGSQKHQTPGLGL